MACNWAPHNLNDVAKAINDYLEGKTPTLPGPDFPTGGLIINKDDIPKIMETGHGSVKIRARYKVEGNKLIFYEVPYGTTIEGLMAEVGEACENKEIEGISDIHDESSKKIRIVVTCERGINPDVIAAKLYAKTNFQTSFSYNQVALIDKTPTELNLRDAIKIYVDHNIDCIIKEYEFDLKKAKDRLEIVEGLLKALEDIDNIIALIKTSENAAAAKVNLIARYGFTENQAKAILAMRLSSLARLEAIELNKEAENLNEQINDLQKVLGSKEEQVNVLKLRLNNLVKKYGDARRTELAQLEETKEEKAKKEIIPEDVVVILTRGGDIKRIPKNKFKTQHKKGVGIKTLNDVTLFAKATNTTESLMIFTSLGKMYRLGVDKIPEGNNTSKGININTILPFEKNEEVKVAAISQSSPYIIFFTKNGLVKKTKVEEYEGVKKTTGIQAIKLKDGDELIDVNFINDEDIILLTKNGIAIRFDSISINPIGRVTSGVKGIGLKSEDEVVSALLANKDDKFIILVTREGKGKKVKTDNFTNQGRGGRGSSCMKLDSSDTIAAAAVAQDSDSVLLCGKPNSICIPIAEITEQGKLGSGNKLIERSEVSTIAVIKVG